MIFAVLDLQVAEVVLKRRFKLLSFFFTIINGNGVEHNEVTRRYRSQVYLTRNLDQLPKNPSIGKRIHNTGDGHDHCARGRTASSI